jgi:DNA adenine methylase
MAEALLRPPPPVSPAGAPPPVRPFLKWAGGKAQLLAAIARRLPDRIEGTYVEPFLGGGAVFFHLRATGRLRGRVLLSDANEPLVRTWVAVRDRVEEVVAALEEHRRRHAADPRGHYYATRAADPGGEAARAARFIYLNKTCYNGLWRVNRAGGFNVPMGRYRNPPILDAGNLRAAAAALEGVGIRCETFEAALRRARAGAVAYLDPPYEPLSATANFTSYTAARFGREEQERLADACVGLRERGAFFLLSNHATPWLKRLYGARSFSVRTVAARRAINSNPGARGTVTELLVTGAP